MGTVKRLEELYYDQARTSKRSDTILNSILMIMKSVEDPAEIDFEVLDNIVNLLFMLKGEMAWYEPISEALKDIIEDLKDAQ